MSSAFRLEDFSTWTPALKALRSQPGDQLRETVARVAQKLFAADSLSRRDARISVTTDADFQSVVLDLLCDDYIWKSASIIGPDADDPDDPEQSDDDVLPYLIDLLVILPSTTKDLLQRWKNTNGRDRAVQNTISHLISRWSDVLQSMLLSGTVLLADRVNEKSPNKFRELETQGQWRDTPLTLIDATTRCNSKVSELGHNISSNETLSLQMIGCLGHVARVLLVMWVNCDADNAFASQLAIASVATALKPHAQLRPILIVYGEVVSSVVGDNRLITSEKFLSTLMEYLKGPYFFDSVFNTLCIFAAEVYLENIPIRTSRERALLSTTMAAFRGQFCNPPAFIFDEGAKEKYRSQCALDFNTYFHSVLQVERMLGPSAAQKKPFLPESWVYELVFIYTKAITALAKDPASQSRNAMQITECIRAIEHMLRYYLRNPSSVTARRWADRYPPSNTLRTYSLSVWSSTREELLPLRLHTNMTLKRMWEAWNGLREPLERSAALVPASGAAQVTQYDFGPLQRCGNESCLCSMFKAKHKMKMCSACMSVVYCNDACQRKDWESHRTVCRC